MICQRFPIDCDPSLFLPVDNPSLAVSKFLELSQSTRSIATSVLSFLLEDRLTEHREHVNATRSASSFRVNDIITARVQQQSNIPLGRFKSFSTKPKVHFVSSRIVILDPLKFAMLTSQLDHCLNFTPVTCSSYPLLFSLFNRLIEQTFAI